MEHIAQGNGTVLSDSIKLELINHKKKVNVTRLLATARTEGLADLFSTWQLTLITVIQIYSWFVNSAAYYGLTLGAG